MPEQTQNNLSLRYLPNVCHNHCPLTLSDPAVLAFLLFSNRPSKESASGHWHLLLPLLDILSSQISMWLMPSFLSALCPNVTLSLWPPLTILYELKTHFLNLSRGLTCFIPSPIVFISTCQFWLINWFYLPQEVIKLLKSRAPPVFFTAVFLVSRVVLAYGDISQIFAEWMNNEWMILNNRLFLSLSRNSHTKVGLPVLKKPSMCHLHNSICHLLKLSLPLSFLHCCLYQDTGLVLRV